MISKILLYAVVPCTIINSYQIDFSMSKLAGMGVSILGAVLVHIIFYVLERVLRRPLRLEPVESASIFYSNAGNLIIPLVMAALGQEWVFYISGYMLVQQLLIWTTENLWYAASGSGILRKSSRMSISSPFLSASSCF